MNLQSDGDPQLVGFQGRWACQCPTAPLLRVHKDSNLVRELWRLAALPGVWTQIVDRRGLEPRFQDCRSCVLPVGRSALFLYWMYPAVGGAISPWSHADSNRDICRAIAAPCRWTMAPQWKVDPAGLEPAASCLQGRRSPELSYGPWGRGERIRTSDILLPKQARYQLRYTPRRLGGRRDSNPLGPRSQRGDSTLRPRPPGVPGRGIEPR